MSEALIVTGPAEAAPSRTGAVARPPQGSLPPVPWRDPHTVSNAELQTYIARLEQACLDHPQSADLRTVLGMAYAMNHDVYKSMDALEAACGIDSQNFWAQMKYAELHYRLRTLNRAEQETHKAIELAESHWQLGIARRQLQEIRRLRREGGRHVDWTKSLKTPALVLSAMFILMFVAMLWK